MAVAFGAGLRAGVDVDDLGEGDARIDAAQEAREPAGAAAHVEHFEAIARDGREERAERARVEPLLDAGDDTFLAARDERIVIGRIDAIEPVARHRIDIEHVAGGAEPVVERLVGREVLDVGCLRVGGAAPAAQRAGGRGLAVEVTVHARHCRRTGGGKSGRRWWCAVP